MSEIVEVESERPSGAIATTTDAVTDALLAPTFDGAAALERARQRVQFLEQLKLTSLRITTVEDWANLDGKPYLESTGVEKIRNLWGIWWRGLKCEDIRNPGAANPCFQITGVAGSSVLGGEPLEIVGGRDGNDSFFAGKDGQKRVDPMDVRKAAYSNFEVQAVTRILGLRGMTWGDIETGTDKRITEAVVAGQVKYQKGADGARADGQQTISDAQAKRMYAIAKQNGYGDDEIRAIVKREVPDAQRSTEIPRGEYERIVKLFEQPKGGK